MSKIAFYRSKCIGCGICYEQQPALWRLSKKDGKATLLHAVCKKEVFLLTITEADKEKTLEIANACPVKIIKLL